MKTLFAMIFSALLLAPPLSGVAAPDEMQKQLIQRTQESKKKLAAAQAAPGAERQRCFRSIWRSCSR